MRFNDEVEFFNSLRAARLLSFYPTLVFIHLVDEDARFQSEGKKLNSRQRVVGMFITFQDDKTCEVKFFNSFAGGKAFKLLFYVSIS